MMPPSGSDRKTVLGARAQGRPSQRPNGRSFVAEILAELLAERGFVTRLAPLPADA
jgi:hypothetical protein